MKFKRSISIITALAGASAMCVSLAGCGPRTIPRIDQAELIESIKDPENFAYPDEVEIRIPVYDRAQAGLADVTDNYWTKYINENFGKKHNIKVTYIAISRSSAVTQFNQRLAGKVSNMPDIVFDYDYPVVVNFAKQGVYRELTDEFIEHFAPGYYEYTKDMDEYTYLNGKKIFLLGKRPQAYNFVTLIRKDWIDAAKEKGLIDFDEPATKEENLQLYRAFKELDLGKEYGGTIPQTATLGGTNFGSYGYRYLVSGKGGYPLPEEQNALYSDISVAPLTWEPAKETLREANQYFNEGLITPDWYMDKNGENAKQRFLAGRAGTYGLYLTRDMTEISELKANVPGAEVTIFGANPDPNYHDPETGEAIATPQRSYYPYGLLSGINQYCKHPEAILMYYEWMYQNMFTMQNGIEGQNYTLEKVSGVDTLKNVTADIPVIDGSYKGESKFNYNNNKDMWCIVVEGKDLMQGEEANVLAAEMTYAPPGYEWMIEKAYKGYADYGSKYDYTDYAFGSTIEALTEFGSILSEKWSVMHTKLVNCKPDEFDKLYDQYCKEYLAAGYQAVLDEKKAVYEAEKAEKEAAETEKGKESDTAADE